MFFFAVLTFWLASVSPTPPEEARPKKAQDEPTILCVWFPTSQERLCWFPQPRCYVLYSTDAYGNTLYWLAELCVSSP